MDFSQPLKIKERPDPMSSAAYASSQAGGKLPPIAAIVPPVHELRLLSRLLASEFGRFCELGVE